MDMLIGRGAKINATNMGDDTALHLAAAHGHREIVQKVNMFSHACMLHFERARASRHFLLGKGHPVRKL